MGQKQFRHQRKAPLTHLSWKLLFNLSFDTIVPRSANTFTTTLYTKSLKIWIFSLTIYQNFFERKNFKLEFLWKNKKVCKFCVDYKNRLKKCIRAKTHFLNVYTLTPTRLRRVGVSGTLAVPSLKIFKYKKWRRLAAGEAARDVLLYVLSVKSRHVRHSERNRGVAGFIQSHVFRWQP